MMEQLLSFFVSNAHADTVNTMPAAQPGGGYSFVIMFVVFFLFIYFAIWRPQSKRAKEQQNLLNALAKGDEVIIAGGLLGRITKMTDQYLTVALATNVEVVVQKASVVSVLPKGTLKTLE
jgi:preprotein translocase subunit YajC